MLSARVAFLRSGINSQLGLLGKVQRSTERITRQGREEFEGTVRAVEKADGALRSTLEKLRGTVVESGLRPREEERRCLLDFVDEFGVEGVVGAVGGVIREAEEGVRGVEGGMEGFGVEVGGVWEMLGGAKGGVVEPGPIPDVLHEMEDHAREMAVGLESLVSHFDFCVTAIRHTEGGGDAAEKITDELPEGVDIRQRSGDADTEGVSDDQRVEMMRVLEEDAGQVEDVVMEIRDHIGQMEGLHEQVEQHMDQLNKQHASTNAAFRTVEQIGQRLPGYITQSQVFLMKWDEEKLKIEERLEELEGVRDFYEGFLRAYDNLLVEIGRRKALEMKTEKVVQDAMTRIDKLYEDDFEEREAFRKEQGDFLPVDIWPGLMTGPMRYTISPVDDSSEKVPDISKSAIHRAIRRVHGDPR